MLGFLANEARQRCKFWKNARGVVANAWNEEDNIIQGLSAFPELEKAEKLVKLEKYVGYSVRYKNIDF